MTSQDIPLSDVFKREALRFVSNERGENYPPARELWLEDVVPSLTQTEKMRIYDAYDSGNLTEGAAHILLGDAIYAVDEEIQSWKEAFDNDSKPLIESPVKAAFVH